jgi:hypothetical protein
MATQIKGRKQCSQLIRMVTLVTVSWSVVVVLFPSPMKVLQGSKRTWFVNWPSCQTPQQLLQSPRTFLFGP